MFHPPTSKAISVVLVACSPTSIEGEIHGPSGDRERTDPIAGSQSPASLPANLAFAKSYASFLAGLSSVHPVSRHASSGRLEDLARDILKRGDYGSVEVSYYPDGTPSLEEAIQRAIIHGAQQIVVTPIPLALLYNSACKRPVTPWLDHLRQRITQVQSGYPDIQIIYATPPYDHERLVDLILSKIRESEPATLNAGICNLNDLASGETALVRAVAGGAHFRGRMASLGFTPGARVKMLQNYGHGAVIVSLRGTRVALGRGEACKVEVSRDTGRQEPDLRG